MKDRRIYERYQGSVEKIEPGKRYALERDSYP